MEAFEEETEEPRDELHGTAAVEQSWISVFGKVFGLSLTEKMKERRKRHQKSPSGRRENSSVRSPCPH
jgi:hypothetical protein